MKLSIRILGWFVIILFLAIGAIAICYDDLTSRVGQVDCNHRFEGRSIHLCKCSIKKH